MNYQAESIRQELLAKVTKTPAFVVDEHLLRLNLELLAKVKKDSGAKILLALKGFAMHSMAPVVMEYLDGIAASGINEACLGAEFFKGEVHVYSPAFLDHEVEAIVDTSDHIVLNSLTQLRRLGKKFKDVADQKGKTISLGLRVNHGYSEVEVQLYNPCAPGSRFGVVWQDLETITDDEWQLIDGLHFHTMCEQGADVLERTIKVMKEKVGKYFDKCSFINLGGGHHITRPGYDVDLLVRLIKDLKSEFSGEIYLEPGEAIALNTGFLVATVVDLTHNDGDIAILDTSATTHMPDVLEMPYRPFIIGADEPRKLAYTYKLGGQTCLAGDVIGDYSFSEKLNIGDRLVFTDMAHYTMVKTTQFNGMNLPDIAYIDAKERNYHIVRQFGYEDYKRMLS